MGPRDVEDDHRPEDTVAPRPELRWPERLAARAPGLAGFDPAAEAIAATRRYLEQILEASPAVTYTLRIAPDGTEEQTWISGNVTRILGETPGEARRPGWWLGHVHPEDQERAMVEWNRLLDGGGEMLRRYRFRHASGAYVWMEDRTRALRDATGRVTDVVGSWTDVSETHALEAALLDAQRMEAVGLFAASIAHRFNNVLHVVRGYATLLLDSMPPCEPGREEIEEIDRAAADGEALTGLLLGIGGRSPGRAEVLDLGALVRGLQGTLGRLAGDGIRLSLRTPEAPLLVPGDASRIEHILRALVSNAREAMPAGGAISVHVDRVESPDAEAFPVRRGSCPGFPHARLVVTDTGEGMDEALLDRIFEPFFTTRPSGSGAAGLGLAIVEMMVTRLYGCVCVGSEPGGGSAFEVRLPVVA